MKSVVFKLKFNHPNKANTPKLNVNHFNYICKRPRAMYNKEQNFCCFGKVDEIGYKSFGDINDFELIHNHILKKSKDKTTFYKCVISLKEEDVVEKGFQDRKKWEELMKNNAKKMAKQMNIKTENFEYVCSVHMEKGHPHIHFMAWDKNQEILKTKISKKNFYNIRRFLTNDVFKEDLQILYENKNKSKDIYKDLLKDIVKEVDPTFNMTDEEYKKYFKELKTLDLDLNNSKIFNINLDDKYVNKIMRDIYLLRKDLPKTGRLNYKFMPENIKRKLDVISKKILANNIDLRRNFSNYIESMKEITKFGTENKNYIDKSIKLAEDELLNFTGNQILNICKNINKKEFEFRKEEFEKYKKEKEEEQRNFEKQEMLSLVSSLIDFISKNESKANNRLDRENKDSIIAKKELAKKMENKSNIEWER